MHGHRIDLLHLPYEILLIIFEKLQNKNSFVWYAQSKGASHHYDDCVAWRNTMNYFVIDQWQHCYNLLTSTNHTTCGAILTFDSVRQHEWNTYYAGNMWWAK